MRLTVEENPASLRRYGHIRPARRMGGKPCYQLCPGTTRTCSREKGHRGPHVAHGMFNRILAVWDGGGAEMATIPTPRTSRSGTRPIGLPTRTPVGLLDSLRSIVRGAFSSAEELAWLVFFVLFVGFAVGGLMLIYLG